MVSLFPFFLAQSEDVEDLGTLTFRSLSDGDVVCADIAIANDTLLEGTEVLTVTLMESTSLIVVTNSTQVLIEDEGM